MAHINTVGVNMQINMQIGRHRKLVFKSRLMNKHYTEINQQTRCLYSERNQNFGLYNEIHHQNELQDLDGVVYTNDNSETSSR